MTSISETSVQYLKGVGPARAKLFENLGVKSVEDLLYLFPRRYEDRRKLTPISDLKIGEWQTITGMVLAKGGRRTFWNKKHVFELTVGDENSRVFCVWFNQPYLERYFNVGDQVILYGRVDLFKDKIQMISPEHEVITPEDAALNTGRIVPIYPLTKGMSQRYLRRIVHATLEQYGRQLVDVLPPDICKRQGLSGIFESISNLHFPEDHKAQEAANRRVSFDEFFLFQISVILRRMSIVQKPGFAHKFICHPERSEGSQDSVVRDSSLRLSGSASNDTRGRLESFCRRFESSFPFAFTSAQKKAIAEIVPDMSRNRPMLRLLQGDVGSGKTVVAFFGCLAAVANGRQAAIMAPTEILAEQHYGTFLKYFGVKTRDERREARGKRQEVRGEGAGREDIGQPLLSLVSGLSALSSRPIRTALLTSSLKKNDREAALEAIKKGEVDIVFGTHALIQESVAFKSLSFVVVDEQHKFGVKQRALLSSKGKSPDVLVMTATPIPRTLCLTLYGDLDVSIIDEKPKGRGEVKTYLFPEEQSPSVYRRVAEWVKKGTQAYIVYPIIDESQKLDLKAASDMFKRFQENEFKDLRVGLVHGRLKREAARDIMEAFKRREIDILVTTTVLEVGIDVPTANVMVIEHAERFGLSQLHQLRGRIGRSEKSAICILLGDALTEDGHKRLEAVVKTSNGFKIAEEDLKIRGPGQYFGRTQHGLNELRVVNPLTQINVLEAARKEAAELVKADPLLAGHSLVRETIRRRYPEYLERILAG